MSEPSVSSYRIIPGALSNPSDGGYLGNSALVSKLVAGFCAKVEAIALAVQSGAPAGNAKAELADEVAHLANIFSGRDPSYSIVKGYNDVSLGGRIALDLLPYWKENHERLGGDSVACLFDWLAATVIEKFKLADGDDELLGIMLKPSVQYAVHVLLGLDAEIAL